MQWGWFQGVVRVELVEFNKLKEGGLNTGKVVLVECAGR